jgi:hypothetical protein
MFNLAENPELFFSKLVMRSQVPKVGPRKIGYMGIRDP